MLSNWSPDIIRWYREASDYTGFFKNVAELITPKLEGYFTFCDIGCGLGLIDLELYNNIGSITCIDINEAVIEELKNSIDERKVNNIEPRVMNSYGINESWDIIYIGFYGSSSLERFLPHCKKLIAVVCGDSNTELYPQKYKVFQKNNVDKAKEYLAAKRIPYSVEEVSFEFGQPLRSTEDAKSFVMSHCPKISQEDLTDFLLHRLVITSETRYPLFMPHTKTIGIFEIEGNLL